MENTFVDLALHGVTSYLGRGWLILGVERGIAKPLHPDYIQTLRIDVTQ
jgi:hypothetical protein